jgi:N-methylhydantoinase A
VLEGKGAKTALITTEGFRDILEFRRVRVPELYNLDYVKPKPLVPRQLRFEVTERIGAKGQIRTALDKDSVRVAAARIIDANVQAVAVCLLHSYTNPVHEQGIKEILSEVLPPHIFVCYSHEVLPEIREYERTSTTVVNAFLGPVMNSYLTNLKQRLVETGIQKSFHVMQSAGGRMSLDAAIAKPAYLVESGPAAGVIAAAHIARKAGMLEVITLDIGGTTAKTAIVENGEPTRTSEYEIGAGINLSSKLVKGAGYAIKLPFIDVSEIGAGGGSHIRFDKGGLLKVGPESAASVPGPVCYDAGGETATLTDAILALGYLNPGHLVGGALKLNAEKAVQAIEEQVCSVLDKPLSEAAFGVFNVAVANMVRAVKSVSTYRGRDPRDYALIAFGGNGPIVATAIAHELGMKQVLVPPNPGVLSSHGLLVADNTHELVKSYSGQTNEIEINDVRQVFDGLANKAIDALMAEGFERAKISVKNLADLRYAGQAFELTVPLDNDGEPIECALMASRFHDEHFRTYSHKAEHEPVEIVNLRVIAKVAVKDIDPPSAAIKTAIPKKTEIRQAYFGPKSGPQETPIVGRSDLIGTEMTGPVIVEEYDSTIVVPPGWIVSVDAANNVLISKKSDGSHED